MSEVKELNQAETMQNASPSTSQKIQLTRSGAILAIQQLIYDHLGKVRGYNATVPEHPLSGLMEGSTPFLVLCIEGVMIDEKGNLIDLLVPATTDSL